MTATQQIPDPLRSLALYDGSPTLHVVRTAVGDKEMFTLKHEPMPCPPIPEAPRRVQAGRRAHTIHTLSDLLKYVKGATISGAEHPIAFYTSDGVSCVLDDDSEEEREVIQCTLEQHHQFRQWNAVFGNQMPHVVFVNFLRTHNSAIDGSAEYLIGKYASLRGELVHDADDYLDMQSGSATFTVKTRKRGGIGEQEQEIDDVPTEFRISVKILADDEEPTELRVMVRMTGGPGASIVFTPMVENLDEIVDEHIDARLAAFAESAEFMCIRGVYREQAWSEPLLPKSVVTLLEHQTKMLAAANGLKPSP